MAKKFASSPSPSPFTPEPIQIIESVPALLSDLSEVEQDVLSAEEQRAVRLSEIEAQKADSESRLVEVQHRRYLLQQEESRLLKEIDGLITEINTLSAPQPVTESIQEYIQRQNQVRIERARRRQQLLDAGVDPSEIRDMDAPIDKRLRQRRETDRPQRLHAA